MQGSSQDDKKENGEGHGRWALSVSGLANLLTYELRAEVRVAVAAIQEAQEESRIKWENDIMICCRLPKYRKADHGSTP
jgi:hypothetical protein